MSYLEWKASRGTEIVDNEPFMLEMNTVPGLTSESLLPQQSLAAGISLEDLFTNAIELAL
jgi:D-alanine-D-alanine ligase